MPLGVPVRGEDRHVADLGHTKALREWPEVLLLKLERRGENHEGQRCGRKPRSLPMKPLAFSNSGR
jgi:hypothetical protein